MAKRTTKTNATAAVAKTLGKLIKSIYGPDWRLESVSKNTVVVELLDKKGDKLYHSGRYFQMTVKEV